MTNEELKKKIVEILDNNIRWQPYYYISRGIVYEDDLKNIADALIAAGLTFDKTTAILAKRTNGKTLILKAQYYDQMKRRAEVAERAARDLIAYYCGYTIEKDIDSSLRVALQQAEQELAKEKKDD